GEPYVLSAPPDRHGEIVFVDNDIHGMAVFVDHDGLHVGRRQCADHELRGIVGPKDDVDLLTTQFVTNRLNTGAPHTDAGTDGVDTPVVSHDGDLGTHTGIAGRALELEQTLLDFRHFVFKEL